MERKNPGLTASWSDVWLLAGVRTPFADYNGVLGAVSPTDLGIAAARDGFAEGGDEGRRQCTFGEQIAQ